MLKQLSNAAGNAWALEFLSPERDALPALSDVAREDVGAEERPRRAKRLSEPVFEPVPTLATASARPKVEARHASAADDEPSKPHASKSRVLRSPDQKRKLARMMAAYIRSGVLVLPPHIKLTKKTSKNEGLEYRAAFNLLLQVVFGDSLKAWSHCSNWFFLHAWILRVSSAVEIDPVLEAQLGDNALLRKSSDQQNAQWRLHEPRLAELGATKEELAAFFLPVSRGEALTLPPPPAAASWASARPPRPRAEGAAAAAAAAAVAAPAALPVAPINGAVAPASGAAPPASWAFPAWPPPLAPVARDAEAWNGLGCLRQESAKSDLLSRASAGVATGSGAVAGNGT